MLFRLWCRFLKHLHFAIVDLYKNLENIECKQCKISQSSWSWNIWHFQLISSNYLKDNICIPPSNFSRFLLKAKNPYFWFYKIPNATVISKGFHRFWFTNTTYAAKLNLYINKSWNHRIWSEVKRRRVHSLLRLTWQGMVTSSSQYYLHLENAI